jgi:16S rRNA (guanine966-N2)-methyltransferase
VREALMSRLTPLLEGSRVLDLFAGSGALGLEALSRGAEHATFVERDGQVVRQLRANVAAFEAEQLVTIVTGDVFRYLEGLGTLAFDIAFADPPYGEGLATRVLKRYLRDPFARVLAVEYGWGEELELPPTATQRRYGDTAIVFIVADDLEEG